MSKEFTYANIKIPWKQGASILLETIVLWTVFPWQYSKHHGIEKMFWSHIYSQGIVQRKLWNSTTSETLFPAFLTAFLQLKVLYTFEPNKIQQRLDYVSPSRAQPPFQFEKFLHEFAEVSRADKWQIREVEVPKYI